MPALVSDVHLRTAHAVARSLARAGVEVLGLRSRDSAFARSRSLARCIDVPPPERDPEGWLRAVAELARPGDVLLPVGTPSVTAASAGRRRLAARVALPPAESLAMALDKERTAEFARQHDIPVPPGLAVTTPAEAEKAGDELGLPAVVKLREEGALAPARRYGVARCRADLRRLYRELSAWQERLIVQRYLPGEGVGASLLASRGRLLAFFAHRRLREGLPDGGPATWCEPFHCPELERLAVRFAEASGWDGLAMLEFKRDPVSGALHLLEVNPRFWGSLPLAVACGVDFPALVFDWASGHRRDGPPRRAGLRRRLKFPGADLDAFAASLAPLSRAERRRRLRGYAAEWLDPRLRLAHLDPRDPPVFRHELRRSLASARWLLSHAL